MTGHIHALRESNGRHSYCDLPDALELPLTRA
jgi:hypothetical protein